MTILRGFFIFFLDDPCRNTRYHHTGRHIFDDY